MMSANTESRTIWQRAKALVVSAGAVATAVIAVVGVWTWLSPRDVQDAASVDLALVSRSTLHEYSLQVPHAFEGLAENPDGHASANHGIGIVRLAAHVAAVPPPDPVPPVITPPSPAPATPTLPSEGPPATPTPTPTTDEGGTAPSNEGAVVFDPLLEPYRLTKEEAVALLPTHITSADSVDPDSASDDPLTNDEVAALLAQALSEVEAVEVNDSVDPFGYRVAVNFTLDGLAGVPLLLTWSLNGMDVSATWQATRLGIRLEPSTDHDTGSVDIWVPDLKSSGDYTVEVKIVRASDEAPLTSGSLLVVAAETPLSQ